MAKDFDSALAQIQSPEIKRQLQSEKDRLIAEKALDAVHATVDDAFKAHRKLPLVEAELKALRQAVGRPQVLTATLTAPAQAKAAAKLPEWTDVVVAGLTAEFRRRAQSIDVDRTLDAIFPGDMGRVCRMAASGFLKAQTQPHGTTTVGAGAEITETVSRGFYRDLAPLSVFGALMDHAVELDFAGANALAIPTRPAASRGKVKPAWIAEHATIPVVSDQYEAATFNRHKLACISTFSNELARSSIPNIQQVIRQSILDDAATALDESLLDAASAVAGLRPAGLRNAAPSQASAGSSTAQIIADLTWLRGQLASIRARRPVFIMATMNRVALEMHFDSASGTFPFRDMIQAGNLFGVPLISSENAPADIVIGLDASTLMLGRDQPLFDQSEQVTLVMANADGVAPTMSATGASNAVDVAGSLQVSDAAGTTPATSVHSVWQTFGTAIRMILPASWGQVRAGVFQITGASY